MTKSEHVDAILMAWDEMDNAAQRVAVSQPTQLSAAVARMERARVETRTVIQRAALALSAPGAS